uniref:Putative secreted protein n=1 Tax=Ixodes ricinus TaxID=34613 RepID=A0A6B0U4E4_IXORI
MRWAISGVWAFMRTLPVSAHLTQSVQVGTRYGVHTGFRTRNYMHNLVYFDLTRTHPSFMSKTSPNSYNNWPRKTLK